MKKLSHLRLWLKILVEVLRRYRLALFLSLLVLILISFAQIKFKVFSDSNYISVGLIGTYQEHDIPIEVTRLISDPLVEADQQGRMKGKIVTGWETNNDATQFKFKLKDDLKWIDNSSIQSQDLEFAIPNLDISFPDNKTVQFNLKQSFSPLPSLLTKPLIKKGSKIGTGPYRIAKIEKSRIFITKIELESKNLELPRILIRFYPNEKVAISGFNLGEVQVLLGLTNPKTFINNPQVILKQKTDYSKIVSILLQTDDLLFSNRSLRQALAFTTPEIDNEETANNPYPHNLWAYNPDAKKYLANLEEGKSALERAQSQLTKEKLSSEIVLTTTPNLEEIGNKIMNSWKKLGLNIKLRVESGIPQNFQALLITQSIPQDPDQYYLWHTTQTKTNLTGYDSKRADKDLEDGRKIIIEEDRKEKYFDFQKTLLEDAPAIFLYFPKYNIVYLKKSEKLLNKILYL